MSLIAYTSLTVRSTRLLRPAAWPAWLALAVVASSVGCAQPRLVKLYDGPALPPEKVATIYNDQVIRVHAIDGTIVGSDPTGEADSDDPLWSFAVQPGEHRIAVRYISIAGQMIYRGKNFMTFKTRFEIGKAYTFTVLRRNEPGGEFWMPVVVERGKADAPLAFPEQ